MTIKQMEERCAMSRTNIRFYEAEGLISPRRRENGYREYSEDDAEILLKVKLLRMMEVPLEAVRTMCAGERELAEVLEDHLEELDARQARQERTRHLAEQMLEEGTDFRNLEPMAYLELLENGEESLKQDVRPRLNLPWRRYWARGFDFRFYAAAVALLTYDFRFQEFLLPILTLLTVLIVEPLFLSMFGTTPGKAIFGIRITDLDGERLDYDTAVERTWTVLWEGVALRIPLISAYFQYKSLHLAEQEIPLSWEEESEVTYADGKRWRYALYIAACAALIAAEYWITGG